MEVRMNYTSTGHVTGNSPYLTFEWRAGKDGESHEIKTQLIGEYNFANALAAVTIGHFFEVASEKIDAALREYAREQPFTTEADSRQYTDYRCIQC